MDDAEARARAERVESLLESLEHLADPQARATATAAVQAVVELYGEAFARMMHHAARVERPALLDAIAADELVGTVLMVHGLHPLDAEARARRALQALAPSLGAHGARAELLRVEDGVARVALHGGNGGCGSSLGALQRTVEETLLAAVPELDRIDVERAAPSTLLQIAVRPSVAGAARTT